MDGVEFLVRGSAIDTAALTSTGVESAAARLRSHRARLINPKIITSKATIRAKLALVRGPCGFGRGRARGLLSVVGSNLISTSNVVFWSLAGHSDATWRI